MPDDIERLQRELAAEKERADYAWRCAMAVDKHRISKEAETEALIAAHQAMIAMLRADMAIAAGILERAGDENGIAWNLRNAITQSGRMPT